MNDSALVSLAILKANWDQDQRGYIHNFVPFVAECLRLAPHPEVSVPDLQTSLEARFGLTIPQGALQTILQRATREKLARREHGILIRNDAVIGKFDLSKGRISALREHEALVEKFVVFCKELAPTPLTAEAADALLLSQIQGRTVPILRCVVAGDPPPAADTRESDDYLVSSFITHLYERDPEGFGYLDTVVKGAALAAVLYLPNIGRGEERFKNVYVFLDTPTLLRALGWEGPSQASAATELIKLARELGSQVCCFGHTLRETQGVLDACGAALRSPHKNRDSRGAVEEHCLNSGLGPSDLKLAVMKMERDLADLDIRILDGPPYTEALTFDEPRLEEVLQQHVGYSRSKPRLRDLQSLAAVYRFRKGRDQRHLEDCKAVFVTPNLAVARASLTFFNEVLDEQTTPLCLPEAEFATLAWLKKPLIAEDLPTKQLLADCYAALSPGDELWRRYLAEIERLAERDHLDEEAYQILRFSLDARRSLMELTLGEVDAFTVGTIQEVLARYRAHARKDLEDELVAERQVSQSESRKRAEAEAATQGAHQQLEKYRADQDDRLTRIARQVGAGVAKGAFLALVFAALIAIVLSLPPPFPNLVDSTSRWISLSVGALVLGLAALSAFNLFLGVSLRNVRDRIEARVEEKVLAFLRKHFGEL
jgi:hypothetical protein